MAIQEIRWRAHGRIDKKYKLFYNRSQERMGKFGTGFIRQKTLKTCEYEFD